MTDQTAKELAANVVRFPTRLLLAERIKQVKCCQEPRNIYRLWRTGSLQNMNRRTAGFRAWNNEELSEWQRDKARFYRPVWS